MKAYQLGQRLQDELRDRLSNPYVLLSGTPDATECNVTCNPRAGVMVSVGIRYDAATQLFGITMFFYRPHLINEYMGHVYFVLDEMPFPPDFRRIEEAFKHRPSGECYGIIFAWTRSINWEVGSNFVFGLASVFERHLTM